MTCMTQLIVGFFFYFSRIFPLSFSSLIFFILVAMLFLPRPPSPRHPPRSPRASRAVTCSAMPPVHPGLSRRLLTHASRQSPEAVAPTRVIGVAPNTHPHPRSAKPCVSASESRRNYRRSVIGHDVAYGRPYCDVGPFRHTSALEHNDVMFPWPFPLVWRRLAAARQPIPSPFRHKNGVSGLRRGPQLRFWPKTAPPHTRADHTAPPLDAVAFAESWTSLGGAVKPQIDLQHLCPAAR